MVFYFTLPPKAHARGFRVYMGRDKYENEDLLKYGWKEDVWFHVEGHADSWLQESGGAGADGGRQSHGAIAGGGDAGHHLLAPLRLWLFEDPLRQLVACTLSDASCEIMGLFVVIVSIFGVSFRPMLSCILFEMFVCLVWM